MMSAVRFGLIVLAFATPASAQTFNEFFRQSRTQRQYHAQQIAALRSYVSYARTGYELVSGGLHLVNEIPGSEWSLHQLFFNGLRSVNPSLGFHTRCALILGRVRLIRGWLDGLDRETAMDTHLHERARSFRSFLLARCSDLLEELAMLRSPGQRSMNDAERLTRLEQLERQATGLTVGFSRFATQMLSLSRGIVKEQIDYNSLRRWYGH